MTEKQLTPNQASRKFMTNISVTTVRKWMLQGVTNRRTGKKVFLRYTLEGGRYLIPETAITEFQAACNEGR